MNIKNMSKTIQSFFTEIADKSAKIEKFVQRKSKLSGSIFLQMFVLGLLRNPKASLNDLSEFSEEHFGINITSQGIDERINKHALSFVKVMFNKAICLFQHLNSIPLPILSQFSAINITDSTVITLPETLADEFPGSGGSASKSALKLQLIFDFLSGCFKTITITDGISPDQRYKQHIDKAEPNSLNIFDLGYFAVEQLKNFIDKGAYFLCRLLQGTKIYMLDGTNINLLNLLKSEIRNSFELECCLGKIRLKCRMCCFRVPEATANLRRRKTIKQMAKKGRIPTKEYLELQNWSIFVTNIPVTILSIKHIGLFYSVRWQIELIFKLWKSHMLIHVISGFRKERILIELYSKLIGLILFQFIMVPLRNQYIDLSPEKAFKKFVKKIEPFLDAIHVLKQLSKQLERIYLAILKFGRREKRKNRFSTSYNLLLELNYYA